MKKQWEILAGMVSMVVLVLLVGNYPLGNSLTANVFNTSLSPLDTTLRARTISTPSLTPQSPTEGTVFNNQNSLIDTLNATISRTPLEVEQKGISSNQLVPTIQDRLPSSSSLIKKVVQIINPFEDKGVTYSKISQLLAARKLPSFNKNTFPSIASSVRPSQVLKVSLVLYTFKNDTQQPPFTVQQVRDTLFSPNPSSGLTMSDFLSQSTYGRLTLAGKTSTLGLHDVYGWYTVNQNHTSTCSDRNYVSAAQEALAKALQQGLTLDEGDLIIVGTYPDGCPSGGSSMVLTNVGNTTTPRFRFISMNNMNDWGNILHEIGHLAGNIPNITQHSRTLLCTDARGNKKLFGQSISDECTTLEYGSPLSIMGGYASGALKYRLFDMRNRMENGDLSSANYVSAQNSGIYTIKKINYADATILRIPITRGVATFNGTAVSGTTSEYLDLTSRDFETFEQASDTSPQKNLLSLYYGNTLLDIASGNHSKILAPQQTATFPVLGITLKNLGEDSQDPTMLRVVVTFSKPLEQRILPGESLTVRQTPTVVTLANDGTFTQPTMTLSFKDFESDHDIFFPDSLTRLYPPVSQVPSIPFENVLLTWIQGIINQQTSFVHFSGKTILFQPLLNLHIPEGVLDNHPRFIYRIGTSTLSAQNYPSLPTYLIYGSFSPEELRSLGIPGDVCKVDPTGCAVIQTVTHNSFNQTSSSQ
jgi:hypothetical protein